MARFGSVITAMVTPFGEDGRVDLEVAAELARYLVATGTEGLVVAGTTGEGPVLSDEERIGLFKAVIAAVDVPVVASTGTNDTAHSIMLTEEARSCGADAILAVTPYYNRPSQAGIGDHFRAIASASDLPIILYDIPVRSGRRIGPELTLELAREVPSIVGVKDATGDLAAATRVVAAAPEGFEVYSGDDAVTLPFLSIGAVGVISVAAHWAGRLFGEMIRAYEAGDVAGAAALNRALLESYAFEATEEFPNPVPAKAACRALGLEVGQCRLPHAPATAALDELARSVVASVDATAAAHRSVA